MTLPPQDRRHSSTTGDETVPIVPAQTAGPRSQFRTLWKIATTARVFLALGFVVAIAFWSLRAELGRQLLWLTVQGCAMDHRLLHAAFSCIEVGTGHGTGSFGILRSPFDKSHIVLTPTIKIVGIETPDLRRADAPSFLIPLGLGAG